MKKTIQISYAEKVMEPKLFIMRLKINYTDGSSTYHTRKAAAYTIDEALKKVSVRVASGVDAKLSLANVIEHDETSLSEFKYMIKYI